MSPLKSVNWRQFLCLTASVLLVRTSAETIASELNVQASVSAKPILDLVQPAFTASAGGGKINAKVSATAQVIDAVATGEAPLCLITRNVKALDREKAPDLTGTPVGLDAIVMTVPASNPVTSLTVDQVRSIWTGAIVNWKEVGGPDLVIVFIGRPKAYDQIQLFCDFIKLDAKPVGDGQVYRDKGKEVWSSSVAATPATDDLALAMMRTAPGAISYFHVEILRRYKARGLPVKGVLLDGVEPTPKQIADGTYFIHRTVNAVTKGVPVGPTKAFVDFLLTREGQQLVIDAGFLAYTP